MLISLVLITTLLMGQVNKNKFLAIDYYSVYVGVRDYIHVVDVAIGHISAMKKFEENCGLKVSIASCFVFYLFFRI
jgi:UDP-glucose 4-epimerase